MQVGAFGQHRYLIVGCIEGYSRGADVVDDEGVEALALKLGSRGERVLAVLGGEADQQLAGPAARSEGGEHVWCTYETQFEFPARLILLELAGVLMLGTVVGDGGRHEQHVGLLEALLAGRRQLGGGLDVDVPHARAARQRDVGGDHRDVGAPGIGFETSDNEVTVVTSDAEIHVPRAAKAEVATAILDAVLSRRSSSDMKVPR